MAATLEAHELFAPVETSVSYGSHTPIAAIDAGQKKPPETADWTIDVSGLRSTRPGSRNIKLTQQELYPAAEAFRPEHHTAIRLLGEAITSSKHALDAIVEGNPLSADREMQQVQMLLPELFCCRVLGDGFATVVNSLMSSFETLAGNVPSVDQIRMINKALRLVEDKPFLSPDEADQELELLESVGLNPYPPELVGFLSSD